MDNTLEFGCENKERTGVLAEESCEPGAQR